MSSLVGRKLGQYEITGELGQGGMAKVYLGKQESIGRMVAVKVLPPHPGLDEAFKKRFQLEAQTIGNLQNPNILPLYDYGVDNDTLFLVMAYAEGGTLGDLIKKGPMDIYETEKIIRSVASGLDYAHRKGVVHRDVKPGNILIHDGHPLLADFGMVKMLSSSSNLTGTSIVGTPAYMAPEQGQGLEVDHRVDIYALAAITYEMLTGQGVYQADTPMQMIMKHIQEGIPDIRRLRSDVSPQIRAVIEKGLAKEPDDRYQSAKAFAEAFSEALHENSQTLAEVQREFPIENTGTNPSPAATMRIDNPQTMPSQQTVVIREGTSPWVIMGGFGLIALVIIIVAFMLISNQNNGNVPAASQVALQATDTTVKASPKATDSSVVVQPTNTTEPTFGEVRFSSDTALGDRVEVRLKAEFPPPDGTNYVAWLVNTETEDTLALGRIPVDNFGEGTLPVTDSEGRLLPANYNLLLITEESSIGDVPTGEVAYSAMLPIAVSHGLTEIFVSSDKGFDGGSLLDGAKTEANTAVQHAGLAAKASNIGGVRGHAEHTINILRGEEVDYDGNGKGVNPGRGVGVYFFIDAMDTILQDITNQPDASLDLQLNAEYIRVCTQNVRQWSDEIVELEKTMLQGDTLEAIAPEAQKSTELAADILDGFDLNQNGIVEPFEGECGLDQISDYGLQFGQMAIVKGDIR